jgi:hypothetical protein
LTSPVSALRIAARGFIRRPGGARRHLAPGLTVGEFFAILARGNVDYVVLRWFDTLPHVAPGEDIDLLVADEDLEFVWSLMAPRVGLRPGQKFDIYSVSGLPGSDFRGVPYYPPSFARAVLDDAQWLRGRYRIPTPQHHFDSLAYHAAYHKGYSSGLGDARFGQSRETNPDHDYAGVLGELGRALGLSVPVTLEDLDAYLGERGLRPPLDTLERLAVNNHWIEDRFLSARPPIDEVWRGLAVFILRERAQASVDVAVQVLDREGFEVLEVMKLDPNQQEDVAHQVRGGNWTRGPWPLSGGRPAAYIIAYDVTFASHQQVARPRNNARITKAKEQLRARLLADLDAGHLHNPVHSSDNADQALDYLRALHDPSVEARVRKSAQHLLDACAFPFPVTRVLEAEARRARVAVVQHSDHGLAVCKVFRPGAARFWEREVRARRDLSDLPEVPALLECGEHWLLTPLYTDSRDHVRRRLPGGTGLQLTDQASRALVRFAVALHERGLFLLDVSTQNLVSDPEAGLKVLDMEFLQEYVGTAPEVRNSYTFRGVPEECSTQYDVPQRTGVTRDVGGSAYHESSTGYRIEDLLGPPRISNSVRRELRQQRWYLLLWKMEARKALAESRRGRFLRLIRTVIAAPLRVRKKRKQPNTAGGGPNEGHVGKGTSDP